MNNIGLQHVSDNSLKNAFERRLHELLQGRMFYRWLRQCDSECSKLITQLYQLSMNNICSMSEWTCEDCKLDGCVVFC